MGRANTSQVPSVSRSFDTPPKWARSVCYVYLLSGVFPVAMICLLIAVFFISVYKGCNILGTLAVVLLLISLSLVPLLFALTQFWVCRKTLK